jgi:Zn-dependent membrane protease YugP
MIVLSFSILIHAVTLPVEYDASFRRALPLLAEGGYVRKEDLPSARRILRAAALTYVAAATISLLDVMRWFRMLRF